MAQRKTAPLIMRTMRKALEAIMAKESSITFRFPENKIGRLLRRVARDQLKIGWVHVLKGQLSKYTSGKSGNDSMQFITKIPRPC